MIIEDLEKEIDNQIRLLGGVHTREDNINWYKGPYSELKQFAKYFFKLGLKTQNVIYKPIEKNVHKLGLKA